MKALCWYGAGDVRVESVSDPKILNKGDAIIRITTSGICGSDLHLYDGRVPGMTPGDILGHEMMGEVVEVGRAVRQLKTGDRVVVPCHVSCGDCWYCRQGLWAFCDNANPNARLAEQKLGAPCGAAYGYSALMVGFAGGQAQYARVPFADAGPLKIPESGLADDRVVLLSDIFPAGYQAAENCNIHPGDGVAVWGCGPVGQLAIRSAYLLGADRVFAIDDVPARLRLAGEGQAIPLDRSRAGVVEALKELTGGRGPDSCIDAVGMEAHGTALDAVIDYARETLLPQANRRHALLESVRACRPGGTISISGVYAGFVDGFPMGTAFSKGLTFRMGRTHARKYMPLLLERIEKGEIDPSFVITDRIRLEDAPAAYERLRHHAGGSVKVVIHPN